ncbi:MAG: ankyrin repeat domain-containing protein [Proteobacteria bacterium]|nr:ankyrin repeat domain-containing protein [Pseudomonadota bacterium]
MRRVILVALAAAMVGAGGMAMAQADAFNDARYYIVIDDAKTLALVDSGQFDINFQTDEGYSILHYAADANRLDLVKALLSRGANPDLKSARGRTPYDMATAPLVKAALKAKMTASAPPSASAPSASAPRAVSPAAAGADDPRRKQCNAKWYADQALCSDTTCKMTTYRKWQQCLKTGRYW